ncbi:sugar ABC transporter substrate-binding protein [Kribbella sandramycini]|uniref:Multiple sugar transport system substrate-binding protein n=1 Tax=Kribbella sandramycini TaxID=60450 RepID=A0A7Y4L2U7_9ACTN|nr:sugar ABC transporter substrate-binding protein [Kribbella sandramycini]MBB6571315.1 multiple sugar transport system substrate-binding protein [Kribbella sandramycini]NOL43282.1 sugar ABC transporter substrate-binding protein [Kribbella sandramycini]
MFTHSIRRRLVIGCALTTAAALALGACGRSSDSPAAGGQATTTISDGPATGELSVWAMGTEGENLPKLMEQFQQANPGVKVNVTPIPWDAAHNKFTTAITAQTLPDAAMVGSTWMGEFADLDALDPTPQGFDNAAFFPGALDTTKVGDTQYGVPWYVETRLVFYRKDLAAKAGFSTPPTDWPGLKAMAKAMQEKAGAKYGINLQPGGTGSWQTVMPFAWSAGAEITGPDQKEFTLDSPAMQEGLQYYQSFFTDKIAGTDLPPNQTEAQFVNGTAPMFISGPWMAGSVAKAGGEAMKKNIGVFQLPRNKTATSFVGGSNFVVFKASKNKDSAWKLVKWLSEAKTQTDWYKLSTDLPAVKSAWTDPSIANDPLLPVFGQQLEDAKAPPAIVNWEQIAAAFDTEVEKLVKADQTPADTAKAIQTKAAAIGPGGS